MELRSGTKVNQTGTAENNQWEQKAKNKNAHENDLREKTATKNILRQAVTAKIN